jgi:2-hydroxy-6-oxonona-2,4-dienedioate hydrolase
VREAGGGRGADAWAEPRFLELGDERWRYRTAGTGPPLVLVHGLGMMSDYWEPTARLLAAAGFHVLAPDLPGFGGSDGARAAESVEAQAAATARFADLLELGPAVYFGHSLSCQTVLQLAADRPERVRALVLVAPTGEGGAVRAIREVGRLARDAFREQLRLVVLATASYLRAGPLRFLRTWLAGTRHDPLALVARVRCPVLVVVGSEDPVVPLAFARELAARLPRGRLEVITGAPHGVFFAEPERFSGAAIRFVRAVPA